MNNGAWASKGVFSAIVSFNRQIAEKCYRLGLEFSGEGAEAFSNSWPGQFAESELGNAALPGPQTIPKELADAAEQQILLRRPFSFADVKAEKNKTTVEILFRVVGPGTLRMTTLSRGDSISVIGPLGRGFWVPEGKKTAILVIGGMGAGPLLYLAKVLSENYPKIEVTAFAGAKTKLELPFERRLDEVSQGLGFSIAEFAKYGAKSFIATDDGTAGFEGTAADCFSQWLEKSSLKSENTILKSENTIIYSCGPEAMLKQISEIAEKRNIDCQISMERMMACGIGLCQSCAVECKTNGANETIYKLCCKDGPVFESREVVFGL